MDAATTPGPDNALVALPELDGDGRAAFTHAGRAYAVFSHAGEVVVLDGACPHKGGPLAEGILREGAVVCPWHWYVFDLGTGQCRTADEVAVRRHAAVQVEGRWFARLTTPATLSWAERLRAHARERSDLRRARAQLIRPRPRRGLALRGRVDQAAPRARAMCWWTAFTALSGRSMTRNSTILPASLQLMMSTPFTWTPSRVVSNSRTATSAPRTSFV